MTSHETTLLDAVAAQMYDDASEPEDPHWDDAGDYERRRWLRRARVALRAAAEYFEREAGKAPDATARTSRLYVAGQLRPDA